jgi:hypothetical protein
LDDPSDFWFWVLLLGFAVIGGGRLALRWTQIARLIEDTPRSRIRSAAQGYVELAGRTSWLPGTTNVAPLTQRPCVWWRFRVQKRVRSGSGTRRRESWRTIDQGRSTQPFVLDDGTGSCIVQPEGAEIVTGEATTWYGDTPWPRPIQETARARGLERDYRYHEERIYQDVAAYVLGGFHSSSGTATDSRDEQLSRLLTEWKRDQAELNRRFDTDRDGHLSIEEWERARSAAQTEVDRRAATRPAIEQVHAVGKPADGQLYLIAAFPEGDLARRYRRRALAAFVGFVAATAALGWLLHGALGSGSLE